MDEAFLKWLYKERKLCEWCHHPSARVQSRALCGSCYRLALDFRKRPTSALAVAVEFARSEGTINAYDWPITGLELERIFEWVAGAAFPFKRVDNPFFHSANEWNHSFSNIQRRILYHYFSLVDRALERRARRGRAWSVAMNLELEQKYDELKEHLTNATKAVNDVFQKK